MEGPKRIVLRGLLLFPSWPTIGRRIWFSRDHLLRRLQIPVPRSQYPIVIEMQLGQAAVPWNNGDYKISIGLEAVCASLSDRQFCRVAFLPSESSEAPNPS